MICERCKGRFGRIGENYWNAQHGTCPICKEKIDATTMVVSSSEKQKKEL